MRSCSLQACCCFVERALSITTTLASILHAVGALGAVIGLLLGLAARQGGVCHHFFEGNCVPMAHEWLRGNMKSRQFLKLALSPAAVMVTPAVPCKTKPANAAGHTTVNHRATNRSATPFHPNL